MNHKKNLALLFGGRSTEHEISLLSAKNIYYSINKQKFDVKCIYITLEGKFFYLNNISEFPKTKEEIQNIQKKELYLRFDSTTPFFYIDNNQIYEINVDIFFPITHGIYGEDGSLQGVLKLLEIPFVGCDVLSSALCMDKEATKKILVANQIPVVPYKSFSSYEEIPYETIIQEFELPLFVKPARQGSSVGVYKAKTLEELKEKVQKSFEYDTKIIIEKAIQGRELECSVLGNEQLYISTIGEIRPNHEFYSYEAKYLDPNGAELLIPAPNLTEQEIKTIQGIVSRAYKALYCEGFARVDLFYTGKEIYINEINTLPGFTNISMYPKLWEYEGKNSESLIEEIINLSIKRFANYKKLKKAYDYN